MAEVKMNEEDSVIKPNKMKTSYNQISAKNLAYNSIHDAAPKLIDKNQKMERVVKGKTSQQKKSFGRRMSDLFFGEEVQDPKQYVLEEVVVPGIKGIISDAITGALDMVLFGGSRGSSGYLARRGHVPYNSIYGNSNSHVNRPRGLDNHRNLRYTDDVVFETSSDAEAVLTALIEEIDQFGFAPVGDFYEASGISSNPTDWNYGWYALGSATTHRVKDGYVLNLPKPQPKNG